MLTAMAAVDNIIANRWDKNDVWGVNTEMDYQETKPLESPQARMLVRKEDAYLASASSRPSV